MLGVGVLALTISAEKADMPRAGLLRKATHVVVGKVTVEDVTATLGEAVSPEVQEAVMTAAEQLLKQGEERGRLRERRENLFTLLSARFGDLSQDARDRVESATGEQLSAWIKQGATASSLQDVFGAA